MKGVQVFGTTSGGDVVQRITLRAGELTAAILTRGAILQDIRLAGTPWPLTLGGETIAAYEGIMAFCGAVVGPVANRIAGASAEIDGRVHQFEGNEGGGKTLHGGHSGIWGQNWAIASVTEASVTLTLDLPDGAGGFPGNRTITAEYIIAPPATLILRLSAVTDAPTLMNLAHHGYWNLDGTADIAEHRMTIAADHITPVDHALIPTGEVAAVDGTAFDFRGGQRFGDAVPLDHNFCLNNRGGTLAFAAELQGARGMRMRVETTEPGLQVYDAGRMDTTPHIGLMGVVYGRGAGVALEPQKWPDAPHHLHFPSIDLMPGQTYVQETRFSFSRP